MTLTPQQALTRIQGTTQGNGMLKAPRSPLVYKKTINKRLYAFERGGQTILAPNDDRLPPILAEYDTPINKRKSPEMEWWLKEYADEMASAVEPTAMRKAPAAPSAEIYIAPMLDGIKWGQGAPWYNNLIFPNPTNTAKNLHCVVGCLATAISMVLYYWATRKGYRSGCIATKAYTTDTYKYAVAALPSKPMFDWENMTDAAPTTSKGKKAVALLCQYVGATLGMDYTKSLSAALMTKSVPCLRDYFGMGNAKRIYTASKIKSSIIAELQKGNPVVMCGESAGSGCHAFVCDGYRSSDDLFHFNWGWSGSGDGWFALTAMTPNTDDFSERKNAIIGLEPHYLEDVNGDGRINMSDVTKVISVANSGEYDRQADVNADGVVDSADANAITNKILGKQ